MRGIVSEGAGVGTILEGEFGDVFFWRMKHRGVIIVWMF